MRSHFLGGEPIGNGQRGSILINRAGLKHEADATSLHAKADHSLTSGEESNEGNRSDEAISGVYESCAFSYGFPGMAFKFSFLLPPHHQISSFVAFIIRNHLVYFLSPLADVKL